MEITLSCKLLSIVALCINYKSTHSVVSTGSMWCSLQVLKHFLACLFVVFFLLLLGLLLNVTITGFLWLTWANLDTLKFWVWEGTREWFPAIACSQSTSRYYQGMLLEEPTKIWKCSVKKPTGNSSIKYHPETYLPSVSERLTQEEQNIIQRPTRSVGWVGLHLHFFISFFRFLNSLTKWSHRGFHF